MPNKQNKQLNNEKIMGRSLFSWKDDFEFNLLIFSIYSILFGLGSFFLEKIYGLFFVYTLFSLVVIFVLTNFTARMVGYRLDAKIDKKSNASLQEIIKTGDRTRFMICTLFAVGFAGLVWSLSWLNKFNVFTVYTFLPTSFSYLLFLCSIWCVFSSVGEWLKNKKEIKNKLS